GYWLFDWMQRPEYQLTPEGNALYQMMNFTGECFSDTELVKGQKTSDYFDSDGNLLSKPPYVDDNYGIELKKFGHLSDEGATSLSQPISWCLRLDPADRASGVDLLRNPFFMGDD
ncbi:hypothetical protein C0992_008378, partial [Termitomyces sp. T32_za158]